MARAEHYPMIRVVPPSSWQRLPSGGLLLIALLMSAPVVSSADRTSAIQAQPEPPIGDDQFPEETTTPWLDEVRAQRQAWEDRRESARSAFEARRRANNPRAAAQQEAWEEDVRRRRAARLEWMDQERERFRQLGPAVPPLSEPWTWPWPKDPPGSLESAPGATFVSPVAPEESLFVPPGWDNHWYFRGF
jgi:hypothetical protein